MARFDVHSYDGEGYLLDCQADVLGDFETRFVIPLLPAEGARHATRLHPLFEIDGRSFVMVTHLAGAIPIRDLGQRVISLREEHDRIMNGLDMLLTGY